MEDQNTNTDNERHEKVQNTEAQDAENAIDMDDVCYTPQVHKDFKPTVGKEFSTLDEAQDFYNAYAKLGGFSTRKWSVKKKDDEIVRREMACFKEGKGSQLENVGSSRRKGSIREGCKARVSFSKSDVGKFVVTIFVEGHSHPLTSPPKVHFLRSYREVTSTQKNLIDQLDEVNIPKHQQFSLLEAQAGGPENIGCIQKDLYNYSRDKRQSLKGHDGEMLHEYMKLEQTRNPSFSFIIDVDEENRVTRCFWADAISRQDYSLYGDVVVFDTTYYTNRYEMIFAPFVGVNNHGQTVLFAAALLNDETIVSFVWLFEQFLHCMPGNAPKMIITDQDPAMTNAISRALPNTFHRYCSWHILNKFSEKLDVVKFKAYYREFSACIWNSKNKEGFVSTWVELVGKSGLQENKWLQTMFDIRTMWVPVYVNHVFSAGMSSSQRAESGHSFLKKFVRKDNSLVDFMVQFARALQKQRHEALYADHKDKVEKPKLKIMHAILVQMVEVYTREMFYEFQEELLQSFNYIIRLDSESDSHIIYKTKRRGIETDQGREVSYDIELDFASCTCQKFESTGITCRHILGYLDKFANFESLPDEYISKRWTKTTNHSIVIDNMGIQIVDDRSYLLERSRLISCCMGVIDKALTSPEAKAILMEAIGRVEEDIRKLDDTSNKRVHQAVDCGISTRVSEKTASAAEVKFREPNHVKTKGSGKRHKGGKEVAIDKGRRCSVCKLRGQGHNSRTCPKNTDEQLSATPDDGASLSDS